MLKKSYDKNYLLLASLLVSMVVVLTFIDLSRPLVGRDTWRTAQTYSVAKNMLREGFSLLPRYDLRGRHDGIFPGEFPLQSHLNALAMKFTGIQFFAPRLLSFLYSCLTIFLFLD